MTFFNSTVLEINGQTCTVVHDSNVGPFIDLHGDETTHTVTEYIKIGWRFGQSESNITRNLRYRALDCTCRPQTEGWEWCPHREFVTANHLDSHLDKHPDRSALVLVPLTEEGFDFAAVMVEGQEDGHKHRDVFLTTAYEIPVNTKPDPLFLGSIYPPEYRAVIRDLIHEMTQSMWRTIKCRSGIHTPTSVFGSAFDNPPYDISDEAHRLEGARLITSDGICLTCAPYANTDPDIPDP